MKKIKRFEHKNVPQIMNEKGTTIEWCKGLPGRQVSIYLRKKGTRFAAHYHTGKDNSKNPEQFFLISGKVKFTFVDFDGKNKEEVIVTHFQEMLIFPHVPHLAEALEDSVFLEYRSTVFDKNDSDTLPLPESIFKVKSSKE